MLATEAGLLSPTDFYNGPKGAKALLGGKLPPAPPEGVYPKLAPGPNLVATGEKKDEASGFTSQGRKEPKPLTAAERAGAVNFGTQKERKPYVDPAEAFYAPGLYKAILGDLAGLAPPVQESITNALAANAQARRDGYVPTAKDLADEAGLQRKVRKASVEQEAMLKLTTALRKGDKQEAARQMALFPRLHKYRDQL